SFPRWIGAATAAPEETEGAALDEGAGAGSASVAEGFAFVVSADVGKGMACERSWDTTIQPTAAATIAPTSTTIHAPSVMIRALPTAAATIAAASILTGDRAGGAGKGLERDLAGRASLEPPAIGSSGVSAAGFAMPSSRVEASVSDSALTSSRTGTV